MSFHSQASVLTAARSLLNILTADSKEILGASSKIIFIVGPTATGKSDRAIRLAQKLQGEIVNCDSIQVYKGLDIGAAKPTREERETVPHHLFDFVEPGNNFTAGDFRRAAIDHINQSQAPYIFFVGGSGFYIRALTKGMFELPPATDELREEVKNYFQEVGPQKAYEELCEKDPEYGPIVNPNDFYRIQRAHEILRLTGKPVSEIQKEFAEKSKVAFPYEHKFIGLIMDRAVHREKVRERSKKMVESGLIEEARSLLDRGLRDWSPLHSVGYKETLAFLEGGMSEEDLIEAITNSTMKLVKRQTTWFRNQIEAEWFDVSAEDEEIFNFLK